MRSSRLTTHATGNTASSSSLMQESHSRTPTPRHEQMSGQSSSNPNENQQQVAQRSRWQAVLLEAGGIGAAVSEESMRRLKYCLQWLQVRVFDDSFRNRAHMPPLS